MATLQKTVAPANFIAMNKTHVMHPNYDKTKLISHAIKIFLLSHPEFEESMINDQLYRPKLEEYVNVIQELYDQPVTDLQQTVRNALFLCRGEDMCIQFTVKKARTNKKVKKMGFSFQNSTTKKTGQAVVIDVDTEVQIAKQSRIPCSFEDLRQAKKNNHKLLIRVLGMGWHQSVFNSPIQNFEIDVNQIHGEGFEEWFDFGREFQALIEIMFRVVPKSHDPMTVDAKDFHMQTVYRMLCKQVDSCDRKSVKWNRHLSEHNSVTFDRPRVEPNGQQIFWRTTTEVKAETPLEPLKKRAEETNDESKEGAPRVRDLVAKKVLYFDLQRGQPYGEDDENRVCLCNYWCNLSAFFDRNPIYRFVVVQNSQLFFEFTGNVPDIYEVCGLAVLSRATPNPNNGLVLPLLRSADEYRHKYFYKYFCANVTNFRDNYQRQCHPQSSQLCAVAYNLIRRDVQIVKACHQIGDEPTDDVCISNLIGYDIVLSRLHHRCKISPSLIPANLQRKWQHELESIRHIQLITYLRNTYNVVLQRPLPKGSPRDRLLGSDTEYQNYVAMNEDQIRIKYMRAKIYQPEATENKFNVEMTLHNFTNTFVWVYKFFSRIEFKLATPRGEDAWNNVFTYCSNFDIDFNTNFNALTQNEKQNLFSQTATDKELTDSGVPIEYKEHIFAFYTLKLYSFGFVIQRHSIRARDKILSFMIKRYHLADTQIADALTFITNNTVIEETFRAQFPKRHRIQVKSVKTEAVFDHFYSIFWGKAQHEINPTPYYMHNVESALKNYRKLFVWTREKGYEKKRFTAVVRNLDKELEQRSHRCQELFTTYVIPVCAFLYNRSEVEEQRYQFAPEMMDVLVLYTVRAVCFNIMATLFSFFRNIYNKVETKVLNQQFLAFNMAKPGWISLMDSMNMVIDRLDQLIALYVIYDDEMERMTKSVHAYKTLVKSIYKHHYFKLSYIWMTELSRVDQQTQNLRLTVDDERAIGDLMELQLMFGLAFTCKLHERFRLTFLYLRNYLWKCFKKANGQTPFLLRFTAERAQAEQYLRDRKAINEANPTTCQIWTQLVTQNNPDILKLGANDVNLDMNQADVEM